MKKLAPHSFKLTILVCLLITNAIFGQQDLFDLSHVLKGTKHLVIELSAEEEALVKKNAHPILEAFIEHFEDMGFKNIVYTAEAQNQLLLTVSSLCDIARVRFDCVFDNNVYAKHRIRFTNCLQQEVFRFSHEEILADNNMRINFKSVWQNMYFEPVNYNKNNRLSLPKSPVKFDEAEFRALLSDRMGNLDDIEGIYQKVPTYGYSSEKHTIGVMKGAGNSYDIYYLGGITNSEDWTIGEWMGEILPNPNATNAQFNNVKWMVNDKSLKDNAIISMIDNQSFTLNFAGHPHAYTYEKADILAISLRANAFDNLSISQMDLRNNPKPYLTLNSRPNSSVAANYFYDLTKIHRLHPSIAPKLKLGSTGTGIPLSRNGFIITNYHVIEQLNYIEVMIPSHKKAYAVRVVCIDKESDLAILQIVDGSFQGLPALPYSFNANQAEVGEKIFTTGFPLLKTMGGELKLTDGIISATQGYEGDPRCYQVSAPVNKGSSGAPLFNEKGELIGIVKAKHAEAESATYVIKNSNIMDLINRTSLNINLPRYNTLAGKPMKEQFKDIKPFVFLIKGYKNAY